MVSVSSERFTSISSFFSLGNSAFTTTSSPSRQMAPEGAISSISGLFCLGHHGGPKKGKGRRKKSSKRLSNSSMGGAIRSDTVFASPFDSVFAMGHLPRGKISETTLASPRAQGRDRSGNLPNGLRFAETIFPPETVPLVAISVPSGSEAVEVPLRPLDGSNDVGFRHPCGPDPPFPRDLANLSDRHRVPPSRL